MEVSTLKLFTKVMQKRSFTGVAKEEHIAPSSVSRAIAKLETELGIRLFQRNTRNLEPTEAGLIYFERVEHLVDDLEVAAQIAKDISEEPRGTLRVSAPAVYAQMYIAPLLPKLHERYPALKTELLVNDSYVDVIVDGIDVAIRLGSLQSSNLVATRLDDMEFFVCASPTYLSTCGKLETPDDIVDHECLLFPRQGSYLSWKFKDGCGKIKEVSIGGRFLVTNSEIIRQLAVSGMGLVLLPDWLVAEDIRSGKLIRLFGDYSVTATTYDAAIWLLRPSRSHLPLKSRIFIDLLTEYVFERQKGET